MPKATKRAELERPARRSRRDPRRERNRKQLIDATLELVAREGSGGLTVTRIARAAGIDPSGFYAHFKSSQECEEAAAAELNRYIGSLLQPYLSVRALRHATGSTAALEQLLHAWLAEPRWSQLMLRARHEDSAIGKLVRAILDGVRKDIGTLLWDMAVGVGGRGRHLDQIAALAELCVGNYMTLLEAVVHGRVEIKLAAGSIARANQAIVVAELKCIADEQPESRS
jgi:AcrR family transcriptional regulator